MKPKSLDSTNTVTRVVHCQKEPYDILIGRPSRWGNPFSHLDHSAAEFKVATRDEACDMYFVWLKEQIALGNISKEDILALDKKTLGCYCSPNRCHGSEIIKMINIIKMEEFYD